MTPSRLAFLVGVLLFCVVVGTSSAVRLPFLKKEYTPLVFFKVPKDSSPASDAMEECVSQVEKELGVKVQRLDVLRDEPSQALLELLGSVEPPILFNRLSLQIITCRQETPIDKQRVIAWAKGRRLPPRKPLAGGVGDSAAKVKSPVMLSEEDNAMDQDELLDDLNNLTPLQRKGEKAIKDRTAGED